MSFLLVFICVGLVFAQEKEVTGTVTEVATGQPLPGVNITVQGTMTGTTTDIDGNYEITVPGPDAVLVFSFVGYRQQEVQVGDQTTIDVQLEEAVEALDEVVVVGYGTQRRGEITGSVSSVDVDEAAVGQVASPQEMIQGRISGVEVLQNSGEPGAGVSIRIRGTTSISAASEPLYVIDGVPINNTTITPGGPNQGGVSSSNTANPLALINPQDIESIQVLKDAAATAIYGSQGANGVILIETKGGQAGGVQVDYSGKVSASSPANTLNLLSGDRYRQVVSERLGSDAADVLGNANTDWQEATMRTAVQHSHNLSFSGGSEATTYRASLGYLNQEGLLQNSGIERVTGRINANHQTFEGRLRFDLNLTGSYLKRNHAFFNQSGGFEGGVIKGMIAFTPTFPVREENGNFLEYSRSIRNPVALLKQITDITDEKRILGNFSTEVDVTENLTAKGTFGVDIQDGIRRSYLSKASSVGAEVGGFAQQSERSLSNLVAQTTLNYNRTFLEDHSMRLLGGYEYKREVFQDVGIDVQSFITDATKFNSLGGAAQVNAPFSDKEIVEQISFFGRLNYNFQDKYLLTATLRRDGSSVFGADQRFAWFPSGSVGWRISNEPFMEGVSWITDLKLRASYGISGNQAVPPFQALATLSADPAFTGVFNGETEVTGVAPQRAANPELKWEETTEFNVGLDFVAGRFDGSVEFYQKTTDDLLLDVRVPPPAPSEFVLQNVGSVENVGVEFSLSALVFNRENWSLDVGANVSSNRNEITDLGGRGHIDHSSVGGAGQSGVDAQRLQEGHPIGAFYGPVFVGINENGEEVYKAPDGGTTTDNVAAAEEFIGNPIPDVAYSFNLNFQYSNVDVSAFFRGEQGREIFNNTALEFTTLSNLPRNINILEDALTDGTTTDHVPVYSSRWIQDASFLRLDKVTIGYNLPNAATMGLRRARIYVSGQNLFVLTPYEGYDPEVNTNVDTGDTGFRSLSRPDRGIDYTIYPRPRTFTFGVELGI